MVGAWVDTADLRELIGHDLSAPLSTDRLEAFGRSILATPVAAVAAGGAGQTQPIAASFV